LAPDAESVITPGNDGLLDIIIDTEQPTYVTVSFTGAATMHADTMLTYTVYVQNQESPVNVYCKCGLDMAQFGARMTSASGAGTGIIFSMTLKHLTPETSYKMNVLVEDAEGHYALYTAAQGITTLASTTDILLDVVLWIGLTLMLLLIAGCVYLSVKNKQLTRELEIELHEVPQPHRAVSRNKTPTNTGTKGKKYARLLTSEEHEEEDAVYLHTEEDDYNSHS
jgi:hypothetical protein